MAMQRRRLDGAPHTWRFLLLLSVALVLPFSPWPLLGVAGGGTDELALWLMRARDADGVPTTSDAQVIDDFFAAVLPRCQRDAAFQWGLALRPHLQRMPHIGCLECTFISDHARLCGGGHTGSDSPAETHTSVPRDAQNTQPGGAAAPSPVVELLDDIDLHEPTSNAALRDGALALNMPLECGPHVHQIAARCAAMEQAACCAAARNSNHPTFGPARRHNVVQTIVDSQHSVRAAAIARRLAEEEAVAEEKAEAEEGLSDGSLLEEGQQGGPLDKLTPKKKAGGGGGGGDSALQPPAPPSRLEQLVTAQFPNQAELDRYTPNTTFPHIGHNRCDQRSGTADMPADAIVGIGDLHVHMFSKLGFGGGLTWGDPIGAPEVALAQCSGLTDHGMWVGHEFDHIHRRAGYPTFDGWPRWDSSAHQQVHVSWLKEAAQRQDKFRLRVVVMTPVNNEMFCQTFKTLGMITKQFKAAWVAEGRSLADICTDWISIERQHHAIQQLARTESAWLGVAKTPEECRALVKEDKLCIIPGMGEAGNVCKVSAVDELLETPEQCIDRLYALGGRLLQLTHLQNNAYAGAGFHATIVEQAHRALVELARKTSGPMQYLSKLGRSVSAFKSAINQINQTQMASYDTAKHPVNPLGLSDHGKALVRRAMEKHMLIDGAHTSERTMRDMLELLRAQQYYPVVISHTAPAEFFEGDAVEYHFRFPTLFDVVRHGGAIGLRTDNELWRHYLKGNIRDHCPGSVTSYNQGYEFLVRELGIPVVSASDLNGAADNSMPRFHSPEFDTHKIFKHEACGQAGNKCWHFLRSQFKELLSEFKDKALPEWMATLISQKSSESKRHKSAKKDDCPHLLASIEAMQQLQRSRFPARASVHKWYQFKGIGSINSLPDAFDDMEALGGHVDCPVCITRAAENIVRAWERAHDPRREEVKFVPPAVWDSQLRELVRTSIGGNPKDIYSIDMTKPVGTEADELRAQHASSDWCKK